MTIGKMRRRAMSVPRIIFGVTDLARLRLFGLVSFEVERFIFSHGYFSQYVCDTYSSCVVIV